MKSPFRKLDPRLAAELRGQRRSISLGLLCVVVVSVSDLAVYRLLQDSINAIQQAAPAASAKQVHVKEIEDKWKSRAPEIATSLGVSQPAVEKAIHNAAPDIESGQKETVVSAFSHQLNVPTDQVRKALAANENLVTGDYSAVQRLGLYSLLVMALFAFRYWFVRGQTYYLTKAANRLASDLRKRLFAKLQRLPVSYYGEKRVGAIQSVLTNDVNVYQNAVGILRDTIDSPVRIVVALGFVVYTQWQLVVVTLLFLPPMAWLIDRNGKRMRKAQGAVQSDLADISASTNESLMGLRVIKAFAAEEASVARYDGLVETGFRSQMTAAKITSTLRPLVELIGAAALASVLYLCGRLSYENQLQLGQIAAVIYALDRVNQGFRGLSWVNNTFSQVQAASERIYAEVLDVPDQILDATAGRTVESPKGRIEFRNVSFAYPDGTEALRNVNFVLEPGTSLALVGPSGAGKSTIADLLLRFYDPTEGQILFDGEDVRDLNLNWLRNQIGVVPQQTFLFAGTIEENIRMGAPAASPDEVDLAVKQAHVDEFVTKMDLGLASPIGEGGSKVSGGQRQRIAIARALVRKPALLLLDEATSALDATSEKAVTEALDEVMKQRTTLFIAHRLTTAARADRILVLSKGQVIEVGSHTELMEANGAYAGLFRAFSGGILS